MSRPRRPNPMPAKPPPGFGISEWGPMRLKGHPRLAWHLSYTAPLILTIVAVAAALILWG